MVKFILYCCAAMGIVLLIKPEIIDVVQEEMHMRERTNDIVAQQAPVTIGEAMVELKEAYPKVAKWTFTNIKEDVGSLIYVITDGNVFNIVNYKANHDVKQLLIDNKKTITPLLCEQEDILNLFAHENIRFVYVQYYDKQGIDYGRSIIDKRDCGLWSFSFEKMFEKLM